MAVLSEGRTRCRTPAGGPGGTAIPSWKFDALRTAIRDVLAGGSMKQAEMGPPVAARLDADALGRLGSLGWHLTTVRLEMEVRGEIERLPGSPVRLRLAR
ncbi:MAG: DUF6958 family protein [Hasllibacter sp.]